MASELRVLSSETTDLKSLEQMTDLVVWYFYLYHENFYQLQP